MAYPSVGEIVRAVPKKQTEFGILMTLSDYDHREAMALFSECSRRPISQARIRHLMRAPEHRAMVLRTDPVLGYIDLSVRRATPVTIPHPQSRAT